MPFAALLTYFAIHALTLIGNRIALFSVTGGISSLSGLLLYAFAEAVGVVASCHVASSIAPKGKKTVLNVFAIFYLLMGIGGFVFMILGQSEEIIRDIVIYGSIVATSIYTIVKGEIK